MEHSSEDTTYRVEPYDENHVLVTAHNGHAIIIRKGSLNLPEGRIQEAEQAPHRPAAISKFAKSIVSRLFK